MFKYFDHFEIYSFVLVYKKKNKSFEDFENTIISLFLCPSSTVIGSFFVCSLKIGTSFL